MWTITRWKTCRFLCKNNKDSTMETLLIPRHLLDLSKVQEFVEKWLIFELYQIFSNPSYFKYIITNICALFIHLVEPREQFSYSIVTMYDGTNTYDRKICLYWQSI